MHGEIWTDYLVEFDYFDRDTIRPCCEPRVMLQQGSNAPSIVLIHGLTDSAYYMNAIGKRFYDAGFNVFIPLLHMHGLLSPVGMKKVSLLEWEKNAAFAIAAANDAGRSVSIGGLSTGGGLAVYAAYTDPRINGIVVLFSAAVDIAGKFGDLSEWLLRGPMGAILDSLSGLFGSKLIGENPYRYTRMDFGGARQLARLIKEIDGLTGPHGAKQAFEQPIFAAHSEADKAADIEGIVDLLAVGPVQQQFYRIPKEEGVAHASVVLEKDVVSETMKGQAKPVILEHRYQGFAGMMQAAVEFAQKYT